VAPDVSGIAPGYQQNEIADELLDGRLATIASGMPGHDAAITIHNRSAALRGARLDSGESLELPAAPYLHLFVARGQLTMSATNDGVELAEGDAVRFTAANGIRVMAEQPSEILVWEMHAALGG
jgi:hypothetical protein